MFGQDALVSLQPAAGGADLRAADMSDAAAAFVDQMLGGDGADFHVVHAHEVGGKADEATVDEHEGRLLLFDPAKALDGPLRAPDYQSVHTAGKQLLDGLPFQLRFLLRGGDHQGVALLADHPA